MHGYRNSCVNGKETLIKLNRKIEAQHLRTTTIDPSKVFTNLLTK